MHIGIVGLSFECVCCFFRYVRMSYLFTQLLMFSACKFSHQQLGILQPWLATPCGPTLRGLSFDFGKTINETRRFGVSASLQPHIIERYLDTRTYLLTNLATRKKVQCQIITPLNTPPPQSPVHTSPKTAILLFNISWDPPTWPTKVKYDILSAALDSPEPYLKEILHK